MSGLSIHGLIRRVDLFTLKLFLSVVEERQIGRAAARENIAPSAATKRMQDLEDVAGVSLLDRNPKGVVPSQAGLILARHIREVFANLEVLRQEISEYTEGVRGHVGVSATASIIIQFLATEIGEFKRNYPLVDIDVQDNINANVVRAVLAGDVDVAVFVATDEVLTEAIESRHYRTDQLVAVVPRGHPLGERRALSVDDLLGVDLIGVGPTTTLMTELRRAAKQVGRVLRPKYSVSSVEAARSLVEAGLGVTVQPECMLSVEDHERIIAVPLNEPWASRSLHIGTVRGKVMSAAASALIEQLTAAPGNSGPQ